MNTGKAKLKLVASISVLMLLLTCLPAQAQQKPGQLVQASAESWLALVDSGNYSESWQEAAQSFKTVVSEEQWVKMAQAVREPLGNLLSRKMKSATSATTLPGAPDGQYVVIRYDSSFEHKQTAVETVTTMLDKGGKWRVSGYYIK
ncbi:MAG: DUF4019 domain-containing protein [Candidatus Sulfotelmatobacter sp.]